MYEKDNMHDSKLTVPGPCPPAIFCRVCHRGDGREWRDGVAGCCWLIVIPAIIQEAASQYKLISHHNRRPSMYSEVSL